MFSNIDEKVDINSENRKIKLKKKKKMDKMSPREE